MNDLELAKAIRKGLATPGTKEDPMSFVSGVGSLIYYACALGMALIGISKTPQDAHDAFFEAYRNVNYERWEMIGQGDKAMAQLLDISDETATYVSEKHRYGTKAEEIAVLLEHRHERETSNNLKGEQTPDVSIKGSDTSDS